MPAEFSSMSMYRLADIMETSLKLNKFGVVEGGKAAKFSLGGHVFEYRLNVIGSCWCEDVRASVLLTSTGRGSLGLVIGAEDKKPHESFILIVDLDKVKDRHKFDSHTTLQEVIGSVGMAIARGFIQSEKEQPWRDRDMSEFAVA